MNHEDPRYPYVMKRRLFCVGKCRRLTDHHSVIYPDSEANTCLTCSHRQLSRYDREAAVILIEADATEVEGIAEDINLLAGSISNRKWGLLGKKDKEFINHLKDQLLAIRRRTTKLKERQ